MEEIKDLIKEGEELTVELSTYTRRLSKWITKSIRIIEKYGEIEKESSLYMEFYKWVDNLDNLEQKDLERLLGILDAIEDESNIEGYIKGNKKKYIDIDGMYNKYS